MFNSDFFGNLRLRLTCYTKSGTPSTTLAPDIFAAILDDAVSNHLTLFDLAVDPPELWEKQRERIGGLIAS